MPSLAHPAPAARHWSSATLTWPQPCRGCWKRRCCRSRDGCARSPGPIPTPQPDTPIALAERHGDDEIEALLSWAKLPCMRLHDVAASTARLLAQGKVMGWFQGRMEFGPRALGARPILASPLQESMQARINELKDREDFRPVAPAVPEERLAHLGVAIDLAGERLVHAHAVAMRQLQHARDAQHAVVVFDEPTPAVLLNQLRPQVYVKGGDDCLDTLAEAGLLEPWADGSPAGQL